MKEPVDKIHYTQLGPGLPDSPIEQEWTTYRREVGRLLAEGHEGRFVLIKGDQIVGLFDTEEETVAAGYRLFTRPPFLVQQVREYEPVYFHPRAYFIPWLLQCHT